MLGRTRKSGNDGAMPITCPLLVPLDATGNNFDGVIAVYGHEFRLKISMPLNGKLENTTFEGDLQLIKLLKNFDIPLQQRLRESTSLSSFLQELQAVLESKLHREPAASIVKPPKYYTKLIQDIDILGWQRIIFIDPLLHEIHLNVEDEHRRVHTVRFEFSPEYPLKPPSVKIDLPHQFEFFWTKDRTLVNVCTQINAALVNYQTFWNLLDDVDSELWILEPEKPLRSDVMRKIALGKGSSLVFTINPMNPRSKPIDWQLVGNDQVTEPLQDKLRVTFHDWDIEKSIVENWRTCLGINLPSPRDTAVQEIQEECGICYSYRLEEHVPEQICKEKRCGKIFHTVCLVEWLRSLSTSTLSFNTYFGECPYCNKAISCRDTNLR